MKSTAYSNRVSRRRVYGRALAGGAASGRPYKRPCYFVMLVERAQHPATSNPRARVVARRLGVT
jgi:hypothetical protein